LLTSASPHNRRPSPPPAALPLGRTLPSRRPTGTSSARASGDEDLRLLKALKTKFEDKQAPRQFATGDIDRAISRIESEDKLRAWLKKGSGVLGAHAAFWLLLILLYPRIPMVQALFFWNPWMRRIGGLGYVGLLPRSHLRCVGRTTRHCRRRYSLKR
jgi:hypothetical protein